MKKITAAAVLAVTALGSAAVGVYAASDLKLFVNGKPSPSVVENINGSSYVPLRAVAEMLGAEVKWNGDSRTIHIDAKDAHPEEASVPAAPAEAKTFATSIAVSSGPMRMQISKVILDPAYKKEGAPAPMKAVVLEVKVENTSDERLTWQVGNGKVITNTQEQINGSAASDPVGGEFNGKVIKTGKIVFEVENLDGITSLQYFAEGAYKEGYNPAGANITWK
ncbi:stalk domain-containing protein [Paenibacillus mucilaginosus]|uniref:Copper amine oxidase-like N-terminal domain-containing protein n=3 Tax=Paenibacillus mucilaginosus TaxID=61624 RepID=H6NCX1_9BACL|nr:stalk domain-containing protein [Paenibacillus mucilaginosus]AFC29453.1 hypothetical protein PM3016_2569 [Paenibacillus mucilaginosus 3016]AFH61630.1 hypothetical protein B2K_13030 [Paenibacillus mucilaginosus K02]AFK65235.1 hypothetical protein [Paenibacillus mucilaginosus K02]MCG7211670.1 copper amine oxidase N-terminal domain-containing protein [Paenibacillus mucilaginosus]WDM31222.1 hypothetical protein KCX80_12840 [Paenibacillus mucilaginosus]